MSAKTQFSYVIAGMAGAISLHLLIQTFFWVMSFGFTFADYFMIWFILLPMPVALGTVAGILVSASCRSRGQMWAFVLAAIGMIGATASIAFGASGHPGDGTASSLWGPILSGTVVELVITAIAGTGIYLFKRLRTTAR